MNYTTQSGSAIFIVLIAVTLFAAMTYAFSHATRSSTTFITSEADRAKATEATDCQNTLELAKKRLKMRGCASVISYNRDGTNDNTGAPKDGSCSVFHTNGGGVKDCSGIGTDSGCSTAQLSALTIGQSCADSIYAGESAGRRFYVSKNDSGSYTFDDGTLSGIDHGANSATDGMANTDILVAATGPGTPFAAAQACRALGAKWFLPSLDQMAVAYDNKNTGDLDGTFTDGGFYWTSLETSASNASALEFINRFANNQHGKSNSFRVRCARHE